LEIIIKTIPVFEDANGDTFHRNMKLPPFLDIQSNDKKFNGSCKPKRDDYIEILKNNKRIGYVHQCYLQVPSNTIGTPKIQPVLPEIGRGARHFKHHNASPDIAKVLNTPPVTTETKTKKNNLSIVQPASKKPSRHFDHHNKSPNMSKVLNPSPVTIKTTKTNTEKNKLTPVLLSSIVQPASKKPSRHFDHHNKSPNMSKVLNPSPVTIKTTKTNTEKNKLTPVLLSSIVQPSTRHSKHHNASFIMSQVFNRPPATTTETKTKKKQLKSVPLSSFFQVVSKKTSGKTCVPLSFYYPVSQSEEEEMMNSSQLVYQK
jgi:hypothetical protein